MESRIPIFTDVFGTPEIWADPYPAYREYREQSPLISQWPVVLMDGTRIQAQTWAFLKFEDVFAALRDHSTFSSQNPMPGTFAPKLVMIQDDPPRHTRFRRIVSKVFTPKRIAELEPWISTVANELLDPIGGDSVDVVSAFTVPLPVLVIARMLGIPGEDYLKFKHWSDALVAIMSFRNAAERAQSITEMMEYFGKMAATRRDQGASDLVTALVEADIDGEKLEEWEVLGFCMLLLAAGNETTTNLLSNMLNLLAERDDLWQMLRKDRGRIDLAIDESLRYESPVQFLVRFTT